MSCTYESHDELRADRARFLAATEAAGSWEPDETGHALEVRRCRACGSLLSDGTNARAVAVAVPASRPAPGPSVLNTVRDDRLPIAKDRHGSSLLGGLLVGVSALAVLAVVVWIVVRLLR